MPLVFGQNFKDIHDEKKSQNKNPFGVDVIAIFRMQEIP